MASLISVWLIMITTAERTVSVVWPFKITRIFSKKNCKIIITSMIIFFLVLTSSAGMCSEYNEPKPYLCSIRGNTFCKYYFNVVYPIFKSLFGSWLPSLIGICLNTIFIIFLKKISNKRKNITKRASHAIIPKNKVRVFQRATLLLIDLNHSTNFIFYVLTAERFRNQLKNIFIFWKKDTSAQVKINEVRALL